MTTTTATFTDRLREAARPIWDAQFAHPFVSAVGDGTLPREVFTFYIRQDARFLDELAKCFAFAATKTNDQAEMEYFGERMLHTLAVERALHQQYAAQFGVTVPEMMRTPLAPTTYAYTRHLLAIASRDSLAAVITAMLPCAWIYAEVGTHFTRLLGGNPPAAHPYADWLSTYASPEFADVGAWMRALVNRDAARLPEAGRQALEEIFVTSSRYEYMFWEMALKMEQWPV